MSEIEELLEEGKILNQLLTKVKKRLRLLSKMAGISIDLDEWVINNE